MSEIINENIETEKISSNRLDVYCAEVLDAVDKCIVLNKLSDVQKAIIVKKACGALIYEDPKLAYPEAENISLLNQNEDNINLAGDLDYLNSVGDMDINYFGDCVEPWLKNALPMYDRHSYSNDCDYKEDYDFDFSEEVNVLYFCSLMEIINKAMKEHGKFEVNDLSEKIERRYFFSPNFGNAEFYNNIDIEAYEDIEKDGSGLWLDEAYESDSNLSFCLGLSKLAHGAQNYTVFVDVLSSIIPNRVDDFKINEFDDLLQGKSLFEQTSLLMDELDMLALARQTILGPLGVDIAEAFQRNVIDIPETPYFIKMIYENIITSEKSYDHSNNKSPSVVAPGIYLDRYANYIYRLADKNDESMVSKLPKVEEKIYIEKDDELLIKLIHDNNIKHKIDDELKIKLETFSIEAQVGLVKYLMKLDVDKYEEFRKILCSNNDQIDYKKVMAELISTGFGE